MRKRRTKVFYGAVGLLSFGFFALGLAVSTLLTEDEAHVAPDYPRENMQAVLQAQAAGASFHRQDTAQKGQREWSAAEVDFIYHQTGLGPAAAKKVWNEKNGEARLLKFQETFFRHAAYVCLRENWICCREQLVDESGQVCRGWEAVGIENGDIIVTKSSHVFGWRNGHAALVIDAKKGKTLEAVVIGENTAVRQMKKWEKYPNAIVLRLSGVDQKTRGEVSQWAVKNLKDIPYRLTSGFWGTKNKLQEVSGTQCAHLIWRAYAQFGYDLDGDDGWIVTPKNLVNSPLLEVVQVYGMDPDNPWP